MTRSSVPRRGAHRGAEAQEVVVADEPENGGLGLAPPLLIDVQAEVRSKERAAESPGLVHAELPFDVGHDVVGGGGREREDGDAPQARLEPREIAVRGTEIVAPLADAMRLIYGK